MRTSACAGVRQGSHGPWRMGRRRWSDCKSQGEGGPQLGQKRCVHREGETSRLERGCLFWELSHRCPGACGFRGPWPQTLCDLCNCFSQLGGPRASEGCAPGRCSKTSKPSGKEGDVCSRSQDVCDPVGIPVARGQESSSQASIRRPPARLRLPGPEGREVGST